MRLLVTGGSGLLGRQLCLEAVKTGHEVYAAEHETSVDVGIPVKLDLLNVSTIESAYEKTKPEVVIHTAALTDVDLCEKNPELAFRINYNATAQIALQAKRNSAFLIYVSTDYVFNGTKGTYKEVDEPKPINVYGLSKLKGEDSVKEFADEWCIVRLSTPYGIHNKKKTFPEYVINKLMKGEKVRVAYDQFTSPTYVPNFCRMLLEVAERSIQDILHLAGNTRVSRLDVAIRVAKLLNLDEKMIEPVSLSELTLEAKRPKDSSLDVSRAMQILREKPMTLETGLNAFIRELYRLGAGGITR
ncbi:MAG: dTDP-4-dehydrorhamnose reductase [Nitrososphaerota archaeon]|nr:dTDP-4-dehydrorhamnose reductase [Aigarchaeota archaeon]MDW8076197.1 dTDP-4-dehydrorhamnose reductase [Nitrososphaerota archaeon]